MDAIRQPSERTPPRPLPFFYLKKGLYYDRIEGGDELPEKAYLNPSNKLYCDLVFTKFNSQVITGLRKCDIAKGLFYGDLKGDKGQKSFIWMQIGEDADTGKDAAIAWVYPDWLPSDPCEYLGQRIEAAKREKRQKTQVSNNAIKGAND